MIISKFNPRRSRDMSLYNKTFYDSKIQTLSKPSFYITKRDISLKSIKDRSPSPSEPGNLSLNPHNINFGGLPSMEF